MIPRLRPDLGWEELAAALRISSSGDVARFEAAFAREMGQNHAVAFPYGRTGLMLLLEALGLSGREVIVPAYTCVVVAHSVMLSGNRPVFVDCPATDFNMDLDAAESLVTERTGALIATSIFGYPVDLDRLERIRRRHPQLAIIQDCAHSYGARWKGRPVNREGVAAIFGINISKLITSIFGGMVTTDDEGLAARLRELRRARVREPGLSKTVKRLAYLVAVYPAFTRALYPLVHGLQHAGWLDRFVRYYDEARIDMPSDHLVGMTDVEARVGLVQIRRYREILETRLRRAEAWRRLLAGVPGIELPPAVEGATYSHCVGLVADRNAWAEAWARHGVELGTIIDYTIPGMAAYRNMAPGEFPNSTRFAGHIVNFPLGYDVPENVRKGVMPVHAASAGQ